MSLLHTDLSWDELSKESVQTAACDNGLCPQKGSLQKLKPTRVILGSLNPEQLSSMVPEAFSFGPVRGFAARLYLVKH
jgi:hypothetical protein